MTPKRLMSARAVLAASASLFAAAACQSPGPGSAQDHVLPGAPCAGCVALVQQALVSTIVPAADAYVRDGASAGVNFGAETQLVVKRQAAAGNTRWSYLRFPLSSVTGTVTLAKLRLHGSRPSAGTTTDSAFAVSDNSWSETGINWTNKPTPGARQGGGVAIATSPQYHEWDVTAWVAAQKAAAATHVSLVVQMDADVSIGPDTFSSREATSNQPQLVVTTGDPTPTGNIFVQDPGFDGLVSMEVENHTGKLAQGGRDWTPVTRSGSSGGALQALPNNGGNVDTGYTTGSPRLDFDVHFQKTGTHYIWMRGLGPTTSDDSYHAGLDGQALASSDRVGGFTTSFTWRKADLDGGQASFNVATAGRHTVNAWMREDGLVVDKIVVTTNPFYVPSGTGPAESPRTSGNLPPVASAGPARFGLPGRLVSLDGSGSRDPDGGPAPLSYLWSQLAGPAVTLSSTTAVSPSFTPAAAGSYRFQLQVSDGQHSHAATVTVTIAAASSGPANLAEANFFHDAKYFRFGDFPHALYDGNPGTLGLANYIDANVGITLMFPRRIRVIGGGGVFHAQGVWTLEAANSLGDLASKTGSYRKLVDNEPHVPDDWSRRTFTEGEFQVFRFTDDRTVGGFVHVNELELTLANKWDMNPLKAPRGLAVTPGNQKLVADPGAKRVFVFNADGSVAGEIGAANLTAPYDVALDAYGDILVADFTANGIVKFDRGGGFVGVVTGAGTAAGKVSGPTGLALDDQGRILVTEVTNHRLQRLSPYGGADTSFGVGGFVGTGASTRTNAGFDRPMDVAWDQPRRQIVVADKGSNDRAGNNRIQVFAEGGAYLRTVSAVYDVQTVAVDAGGTIYAGGGVTPTNLTMGALRIIQPGDQFVTGYYRNGLAGLGQSCEGLAWDTQGKLIISDKQRHVLHSYEPGKLGDIHDVTTRSGPTWVEIAYRTHLPAPTVVHWGKDQLEASHESVTPTTTHLARINGLTPSTRYLVVPTYRRPMDGGQVAGRSEVVGTEPAAAGQINVVRIDAATVIYTNTMSPTKIQQHRDLMRWLREFYFRNTHGRLWLDTTVIESPRVLTAADYDNGSLKPSIVQADLSANGFSTSRVPDLVVVGSRGGGNLGGIDGFYGREAGYARYSTESAFTVIHEVGHALDSMFDLAGMPHYDYNHGLWFVAPAIKGLDGAVNAEINRKLSAANVLAMVPRWGSLRAVADADGDGVSEEASLPVTEATLPGNPASADSDGDGLTDLQEMERGIFRGTPAGNRDGDGDGATQGDDRRDRNPVLPVNAYVARSTPVIDGTFNAGEGWTLVMSGVNFANAFSLHTIASSVDTQEHLDTRIWSAWDSTGVYFAVELTDRASKLDRLHFRTDLNDQGLFSGLDKHYLKFLNGMLESNRLHAMTQDISSIVGGGEWADLYDDSPEWTGATQMNLPALFAKSELLTNIRQIAPERYYVEIKIPAGARRSFTPASGKPINFIAYHETDGDQYDVLTEMDSGIRLLLVDRIDSDGDGLWDQQEVDIGRDPLVAE
jgi:hypothetical protein